jgi:Yip1 domain
MAGLVARMIRAAQLDATLYEEVEADHRALGQATTVVILASLAAGVGSRGSGVPGGVVATTLAALLGWYIWAYLTYLIGTRWLPEPHTEADWGQLLRTIGFASAPGVLRVVGSVLPGPGWTGVVFLTVAVWMLVAMVIAVRQALDYASTVRAVGWVIYLVVSSVLLGLLGGVPLSSTGQSLISP